MVIKNSDKAVKKTTNTCVTTADDSGTRCLDNKEYSKHQNPLDIEYVNEMHVKDFTKALEYDPLNTSESNNPEHISAWTDALPAIPAISNSTPIKAKSKRSTRRKLAEQEAATPKGFTHALVQYPLIVSCQSIYLYLVTYFLLVYNWFHYVF